MASCGKGGRMKNVYARSEASVYHVSVPWMLPRVQKCMFPHTGVWIFPAVATCNGTGIHSFFMLFFSVEFLFYCIKSRFVCWIWAHEKNLSRLQSGIRLGNGRTWEEKVKQIVDISIL